jgi:hypothetical protein
LRHEAEQQEMAAQQAAMIEHIALLQRNSEKREGELLRANSNLDLAVALAPRGSHILDEIQRVPTSLPASYLPLPRPNAQLARGNLISRDQSHGPRSAPISREQPHDRGLREQPHATHHNLSPSSKILCMSHNHEHGSPPFRSPPPRRETSWEQPRVSSTSMVHMGEGEKFDLDSRRQSQTEHVESTGPRSGGGSGDHAAAIRGSGRGGRGGSTRRKPEV